MNDTVFITWIIMYFLGYVAGYMNGKHIDSKELVKDIGNYTITPIKKLTDNRVPAGPIHRPTVQEINKRNEPEKVKQAKEAVKESLDKIPELQEHKRLVEEYNKSIRGIYD